MFVTKHGHGSPRRHLYGLIAVVMVLCVVSAAALPCSLQGHAAAQIFFG